MTSTLTPSEASSWVACPRGNPTTAGMVVPGFGPRTIDVDILLYKGQVYHDDTLLIPHPRMHERRFVLVPLVEIAPGIRVPGERTRYADILAGLDERKKVAKSKENVS